MVLSDSLSDGSESWCRPKPVNLGHNDPMASSYGSSLDFSRCGLVSSSSHLLGDFSDGVLASDFSSASQ